MTEKSKGSNSASQLTPGTIFDKYKVIRLLGRGGMGEVYEVEHLVLKTHYAIKLLPSALREQQGFLERFKREAQVMAQLEHPNIIHVDDFGETDRKLWLRMELAEGIKIPKDKRLVTLKDLAEHYGGKIEQGLFLSILEQVLEGLSYAHAKGAVHRDLKPDNILITGGSIGGEGGIQAKISDFGLVKLVGEEWVRSKSEMSVSEDPSLGDMKTEGGKETGSSTRALLGTYEYMSPEQKRGESVDVRSDIYALGLITYKLLTGMKEITFKLPSQINNKLNPLWDILVEKTTQPNRKERIESAERMLEIVREIRRDEEKGGDKEPPKRSSTPTRTRVLWMVFVLALAFLFLWRPQNVPDQEERQQVQSTSSVKSPAKEKENDEPSKKIVLNTTSTVMSGSEEKKKPPDHEKKAGLPEPKSSYDYKEYRDVIEQLKVLKKPDKQPESTFTVDIWTSRLLYHIGDEIIFKFKANRDCYLTILDIGTSGDITILFPNRFKQHNLIRANTLYTIPSEEYDKFSFGVEPPPGTERVKAIASLTLLTMENFQFEEYKFRSINPNDTEGTRDIGVYLEKLSETPKRNEMAVDSLSIQIE